MTIRKKTLLVICGMFLFVIPAVMIILWVTLLKDAALLEENTTKQNLERVTNTLNYDMANLGDMASDWASWDDTYTFIEDGNNEYIKTNLVDGTFTSLKINYFLFINLSGKVIYNKAFDLQAQKEIPIPPDLQNYLSPDNLLISQDTESSIDGLILISGSPTVIVSRPILTSEDAGPFKGTLIMGRSLDDTVLQGVAEETQIPISSSKISDSQMPPDFQAAYSYLSKGEPFLVNPLDRQSIAGYTLLQDIYGNPALILKVVMPRDIYRQGWNTCIFIVASLLGLGICCVVGVVVLLQKNVLSRMTRLSNDVANIGKDTNFAARVSTPGKDEISNLSNNINYMLAALQKSESKLKELYAKETQLRQKLEDEMNGRIEFTRALVHELKTPLTPMLTSSDMLVDEITQEPLLKLAKNINRGARRLNKRIDELLDVAKGEIGILKLNLNQLDPSHILQDAIDEIAPLALRRHQTLELDFLPSLPPIRADEERLKQIISNLLNNACKFTPEGGKIVVRASENDTSLVVEIQDTGPGIAPEDQQRLFQSYYRNEKDTGSGLGLGLALSKRLVELHGGQVWVRSCLGEGSTFGFSIPINQSSTYA